MKSKASFLSALKVKYPIIQAPVLGVSMPEMAAIVSNKGVLVYAKDGYVVNTSIF